MESVLKFTLQMIFWFKSIKWTLGRLSSSMSMTLSYESATRPHLCTHSLYSGLSDSESTFATHCARVGLREDHSHECLSLTLPSPLPDPLSPSHILHRSMSMKLLLIASLSLPCQSIGERITDHSTLQFSLILPIVISQSWRMHQRHHRHCRGARWRLFLPLSWHSNLFSSRPILCRRHQMVRLSSPDSLDLCLQALGNLRRMGRCHYLKRRVNRGTVGDKRDRGALYRMWSGEGRGE
jgi:hypothetical protein